MSLSVFNGLLYGGDMAPDVKQGAAGQDAWDEMLGAYSRWRSLLAAYRCGCDAGSEQTAELRRIIRKWEINFLIVCAQFAVVLVAAVWGWTR